MPPSIAAATARRNNPSSMRPYVPPISQQPKPIAETFRPVRPNGRYSIGVSLLGGDRLRLLQQNTLLHLVSRPRRFASDIVTSVQRTRLARRHVARQRYAAREIHRQCTFSRTAPG